MAAVQLEKFILDVPDFPKKGIVFKDITPLLADPGALAAAIKGLAARYRDAKVDLVASAEARGFLFGPAVAVELKAGFAPIRKPGKLPRAARKMSYQLEYGSDTIEMHADAVKPGQRVLLVDDVIATGGTMEASAKLVEEMGGKVVGMAFLIELAFLKPRERLAGREIFSLVTVK
ncbi:MAG TPA: adenine phosphoribosyltransferase [Planctomycetota bacterium]|nr:adenine phosphoribosyltransferase [Planctomycetota bacterium]